MCTIYTKNTQKSPDFDRFGAFSIVKRLYGCENRKNHWTYIKRTGKKTKHNKRPQPVAARKEKKQ